MSPADLLQWLRAMQTRPSLSLAARAVGLGLALRVNARTGACFPSKACLAADTGLSEPTIRRAVRDLVKADLLSVEFSQGRLANRYKLHLCGWNPSPSREVEPEANPVTGDHVGNPLASEEVTGEPTPSPVRGLRVSQPRHQRSLTPSPEIANPVTSDPRKEQKKEQKKVSVLSGSHPTVEMGVEIAKAEDLIAHLNSKAGTAFMVRTQDGKLTKAGEDARHRIAEHGLERMKAVVDRKAAEWGGTEMAKFLRPATLFRKSNAENYVGQLGAPTPPPGTRPAGPGGTGPEPIGAAYQVFRGFD